VAEEPLRSFAGIAIIDASAWGAAILAAENTPIEPVWVMPAKGAAMNDRPPSIQVNGKLEPLAPTLAALLRAREIAPDARGVAVAINGAVVPRAAWPATKLAAGDAVEIVRARQGG
jgi:sulfur carrier protein